MNKIHPIKHRQNKIIAKSIDRASDVVAGSVWDQRFEQASDQYIVPIGAKPDMIGTVRYETFVGHEAMRKLARLGMFDIAFDPEATDTASRHRSEGYCNNSTDYDRKNLMIVMQQSMVYEVAVAA